MDIYIYIYILEIKVYGLDGQNQQATAPTEDLPNHVVVKFAGLDLGSN